MNKHHYVEVLREFYRFERDVMVLWGGGKDFVRFTNLRGQSPSFREERI
ncbi:hypothetical protein SHEEN_64 [Mycobacterium phage Sheen]|uniref:Uncharacterized protein n=1 Tax=Mycobacterium phage Sheen TaxID=1589274 RepID=A0A0B4ZYH2_9CAUD|nr:hypothetical protein AVV31_gp30 [Mycobacterium phage Sheen]AJD82482.1 hypothetical protein SHEEN_64 [Mycobacterium phage Sheen]